MISELHMWLTFGVIAGAMLLYVTEFVAIEMTSLLALVAMLLLFTLFPQIGPDGSNLLDATALLAGFGNPALITVMALLVTPPRTDKLKSRVSVRLILMTLPTVSVS